MVDIGLATDNCPPLCYRYTTVERAGLVVYACLDLRPGHSGLTFVTQSGHALPNQETGYVHYFLGFTSLHVETLVAREQKTYQAARAAADREHIVKCHEWYWRRLEWGIRLTLDTMKLGKKLHWSTGNPLDKVEK